MKIANLYSFDDIRIEDIAVPEIGPNDALIKTKACGICSGDVMPWYIEKKAPLVLGHEPAGEIVVLGDKVSAFSLQPSAFKVGDRVFVHHHAPCMECRHCEREDYVQCSTWKSSRIIPGGISEYILIPEINLRHDTLKIPESISYEDATLVEPTACVVKSLSRANIKKNDTILIIGLGVMGQLHILLAKQFGARIVIGADLVPFRLNKALEFGADYVINISKESLMDKLKALTQGRMADIVIVGPNSVEAMKQGIDAVSCGGTIVLFTPAKPDEMLNVDPNYIYFKDITITASYSCGPNDTKEALSFIEQGLVTAEKIVTHRFPIEKTASAYKLTSEARDSLKAMVVF